MLWEKLTSNKKYIILIVFIGLFLLTRIPRLADDEINPDGVNWYYRSQQFFVALRSLNLEDTYQHYHPGVTLMWIMGGTVTAVKKIGAEFSVINSNNFLVFHFYTKLMLVLAQLALTLIAVFVLSKIMGLYRALFSVLLFTFEPFFVGNSRILHLDVLMTLFLLIGLGLAYINYRKFSWYAGIFSGIFLGLAFLTKSISVIALPFVLVFGTWFAYKGLGMKVAVKYFVSILFSFLIVLPIVFPALLVAPVKTMIDVFSESERIGARRGHIQIVLGEEMADPGLVFYFLVLIIKVSIVSIVGFFIYLFYLVKKLKSAEKKNVSVAFQYIPSFIGFLFLFYLGYFITMSVFSKKIDRYMLPLYPFFAISAVYGYFKLHEYLSLHKQNMVKHFNVFLMIIIGFGFVYPLIAFFPFYFTYTSPVVFSPGTANTLIAQKPFGVGIPDLKNFVLANYSKDGDYPTIGFLDTKPMSMIYMNSRLVDIREVHASQYRLLILGPNEEFPDRVLDSKEKYYLDKVLKINGLDYWRIYVRQT